MGTVVAAPSLVEDEDCFSDCWLLDCCEPLSEVTLTADAVTVAVTVTALELPLDDDVDEEVGGDPPPLAESASDDGGDIFLQVSLLLLAVSFKRSSCLSASVGTGPKYPPVEYPESSAWFGLFSDRVSIDSMPESSPPPP